MYFAYILFNVYLYIYIVLLCFAKAGDAPGHETLVSVLSLQSLGKFATELLCVKTQEVCYPSLRKFEVIVRQVYPMSYVILKALVVVVVVVAVVVVDLVVVPLLLLLLLLVAMVLVVGVGCWCWCWS